MDPEPANLPETGASEYEAERRRKRQELRQLGVNPYGRRVENLTPLSEARAAGAGMAPGSSEGPIFTVAGRIILKRDMGKLSFLTIRDETGDLQVGLQRNKLDEQAWEVRNRLDLGDHVVANGPLGTTKTGEPTIWATSLSMSAKSLLVPPEKHKGLEDVELRYRRRYVDLWANPETMRLAQLRIQIVERMRRFWREKGFLEVETPMLQPLHGGAATRPFVTHMNALDMELYLRIAPELYLKRLLVGGFRKVFEINRNFRNEGISPRHNPEFTMLEAYEAYGSWETMAALVEEMICTIAQEVLGTLVIRHGESDGATERRSDEGPERGQGGSARALGGSASPRAANSGSATSDSERAAPVGERSGRVIDLRGDESKPSGQRWRRVRMVDLVREETGWKFDKRPLQEGSPALADLLIHGTATEDVDSVRVQLRELGLRERTIEVVARRLQERVTVLIDERLESMSPAEQLVAVYEKLVEPRIDHPVFVTHVPSVIIPLARPSEEDPYFAEVYELAINGTEISPGYTELNDPDVQEQLFRAQVGDEAERQQIDEDFLTALKYGMPPRRWDGPGRGPPRRRADGRPQPARCNALPVNETNAEVMNAE